MTDMIHNTTNVSWSNYIRETIEGCDFSQKAEMDIITLVHNCDMTYNFFLKHSMPAFEWKLNSKIIKDKNLINMFPILWRHPINNKFNRYRNNNNN